VFFRASALAWGGFAVTVGLLYLVFEHAILHLSYDWQKEEYSHGYLLPVIALLMGLHRLAARPSVPKPTWKGIGLLLFGLAIATFGAHAAARHFVLVGLWLSLISLSLVYLGAKSTAILMPAFVYLLFSFPAPTELYANLSLELQLLSSSVGAALLDLLGISVLQNGNIIDLGTYSLQVVEACSGLRYLFPLVSFGYLIAYLLKDSWWKRAVILFSTIPIAIAMNVVRIAAVGIAVEQWGPTMAEGVVHDFQGWLVFLLCICVLMVEVKILSHIGNRGTFDLSLFSLPRRVLPNGERVAFGAKALVFLLIIVAVTPYAINGGFGGKSPRVPIHGNLSDFPLTVDAWKGTRNPLDPEAMKVLRLTDYAQIDYTNPTAPVGVNLYVAYLGMQTLGIIIHPPTNCLPGAGWKIVEEKVVSFAPAGRPPFDLVRILVQSGERKQLVYFWYEQQGRRVTSQLKGRFQLMLNSLLYNRTDGALVRVITPIPATEQTEAAEARAQSLLQQAIPHIENALPKPARQE
jgi:exosortase D (VPLPA-CTERM-specific)